MDDKKVLTLNDVQPLSIVYDVDEKEETFKITANSFQRYKISDFPFAIVASCASLPSAMQHMMFNTCKQIIFQEGINWNSIEKILLQRFPHSLESLIRVLIYKDYDIKK